MNLKTIREDALDLPATERAELAETLLESLDSLVGDEIERLWFEEAASRARQVDEGSVALIPAEEVARKARAILK